MNYTYHPTPTQTRPEEWARLDYCLRCMSAPGEPCVRLGEPGSPERHRPHPERLPLPDRDPDGTMLMGMWAATGRRTLRPRMHASLSGTAGCGGEALGELVRWTRVGDREACQRQPCKRLWRAELLK